MLTAGPAMGMPPGPPPAQPGMYAQPGYGAGMPAGGMPQQYGYSM